MIIIIPGWLISLVTFPGIVMHEIAHKFMCDMLNVPVYNVNYFSLNSTQTGHVYHKKTDNITQDLLIGFAPLFINTFFCMIFTLPLFSTFYIINQPIYILGNAFLYWVGISIGMHAFPSSQDAHSVLVTTQENNGSFFIKLLCYVIKAINFIRCAPLDFLYAFLMSFILPGYIFMI